ncbi:MAG: pantoate--beta-alanine ligase [Verrucomicrobiota bacterium]|nr:pantoate--beta-alanine ligase [Verrucomicrobiota bacterium]
MIIIDNTEGIRRHSSGKPRVLVPTMGALHPGHDRLIRKGRSLAGKEGQLVVSVFVNPTQFGDGEDFESYPRTPGEDQSLCSAAGTDILFQPTVEQLYSEGEEAGIKADTRLTGTLCGPDRPGHFDGVCTVVEKLFSLIEPDIALFGKKDYQQLAVIRQMTRDLKLPVRVIGAETIREEDGLAMSSRNRYLSAQQRAQAPALFKALKSISENNTPESAARIKTARNMITCEAPLGKISYLQIVDRQTMQELSTVDRPAIAATAVHFGNARLIDNIEIDPANQPNAGG